MRNRIHRRRPAAGFTLMEVLLVLIILVMLGSLAMQAFTGTRQQADINTAKTQAQAIAKAAQSYELTMRQYPTGIQDLFQAPSDAKPGRWNGPYLEGNAAPLDPWDNAYQYANPGT